jgi:hypothetical protein
MSFLAFAGGAADAFNKKVEEDRKSARRIGEMKFGADYNMYLSSIKERTNEKKKHEQALAWAQGKTQNKDQQKILYKQYMGSDGDSKALEEWYSGKDFSGVTPESVADISTDFNPTTEIFMTPTLKKYGVDPNKWKTDPQMSTITEGEKRFVYENSKLPAGAPMNLHYKSAVEEVRAADIAKASGTNVKEVKKAGMVNPPVSEAMLDGRGVTDLPSKFQRLASELGPDPRRNAEILAQVDDPKNISRLETIAKRREATGQDMGYLADDSVWESNRAITEDGVVREIEIATTPEGVKYGRFVEDDKIFPMATKQIRLTEVDATGISEADRAEISKSFEPLIERKREVDEFGSVAQEAISILDSTPEAVADVTAVASGINRLMFNTEAAVALMDAWVKGDESAGDRLYQMHENMFAKGQAQLQSMIGAGSGGNIQQILNNAKRLSQVQLQLTFRTLAFEGQSGRDVSVKEFEEVLASYSGRPEAVKQSIISQMNSNTKRLSIAWENVDARMNATPKRRKVFHMQTGETAEAFVGAGIPRMEPTPGTVSNANPVTSGNPSKTFTLESGDVVNIGDEIFDADGKSYIVTENGPIPNPLTGE